ncbi:MAG: phosphoribosylamine--glycine ligase [Bacteroidia bacterium]|nr:phosphoribosylamine--glycine ligase [Bacteroidia bacterium]
MKVLLLGSGGREHAFAWKISQSPLLSKLYIAPGNAGTASCGTNVALLPTDFNGIRRFVTDNEVDLVVVGPEEPLVKGIRDYFQSDDSIADIPVIGPSMAGARLEGSKDFSKQFMFRHSIPTAAYRTFRKDEMEEGMAFLETLQPPFVLKADGLAAGKGVVIPETLDEARQELRDMLGNAKFGTASSRVVIEEFLKGIELSVFVLTDGHTYMILPSAKDYKRVGEGDTGLNTGGMGAVSPVPFADDAFLRKVEERIVKPTMKGLLEEKLDYKGFLFIGLMNCGGDPFVIEYNCRMGDPETEVVLPRIQSDLLELLSAVGTGTLANHRLKTDPRTAVTVMLVSGGYPGDYEKGKEITGLDQCKGSEIFHAGTSEKEGKIFSAGGRVLAVTTLGQDIKEAVSASLTNAAKIKFDGKYYRSDIGKDLL